MITDQTRIDIRNKERKTWIWIKQRLAQADSSFAKLTRLHGVKKQNIAIVKHSPYPKYERLIAESIGLDPWDLWPDRYDAAGNPNRISTRYRGHEHFLQLSQNRPKVNGKERRRVQLPALSEERKEIVP